MQSPVWELELAPHVKERRILRHRRRGLVRSHFSPNAPRVVPFSVPRLGRQKDAAPQKCHPTTVATKLPHPDHVLGELSISPSDMAFLFVHLSGRVEENVESETGLVCL